MAVGSWLMELGVRTEQLAQQIGIRGGAVPLQWPRGPAGSLIYRLPSDPHRRASLFATSQTIVVNEGETALVLEDGRAQGALDPGRYTLQKARVVGSLDVVWLKTGQQALKWGLGNVMSGDGIQVSANGVLYARVSDPLVFNSEVVQGAITIAETDIQRTVLPRIQGVLRSTIPQWPAMQLQSQRDTFTATVRQGLTAVLEKLGLSIADFEIVEFNFPPEFKAIVAQATMSQFAGAAAVIDAQARAQVSQIDAVSGAQSRLVQGMVDVQLFAQLQAQGIDPLKLKALEALNTMAANPGQGNSLTGDAARANLFGQVAVAALAGGQPLPVLPMVPTPLPQLAMAQGAPSSEVRAPDTALDIERQIDGLVDRLAEGKISEDTYNKLVARLEGKLAALRG